MEAAANDSRLGFGKMEFGCKHYRRRCKIRAPCCNEIFYCRHCHNESTSDRHELCRQDVQKVICLICNTEQPCAQTVELVWGTISAMCANSTMMIWRKGSTIAMIVASAESVVARISFTARNVYLFDSLKETSVLKCGHTIHFECFDEMLKHAQRYSCPVCSKSIAATIMPEDYRYKVWILCNDCNNVSEVFFHIVGHKCSHCLSYNTRTIANPPTVSAQ
ncbi:hypothetical protein C4D60_Mb06t20410 [Musa balbisiana]|uniref:CHY-type domain-containing protein n=1 Tax=Musa balbisiana TaxID=52838 RepID=A0A4V4H417_MUSBA|nr:hypothetical protein C4D60_Mb06t20410 [Musa balbisiana]